MGKKQKAQAARNQYQKQLREEKKQEKKDALYRERREAFIQDIESNNEWDKLEGFYREANQLFYPIRMLVDRVKGRDFSMWLDEGEMAVLREHISILTRDLAQYGEEIKKIHAIHADRSGQATIEDFDIILGIAEKYMQFGHNFMGVVQPTYDAIVDIYKLTEYREYEHNKLTKEISSHNQSNTEVSDAVYTEVQ